MLQYPNCIVFKFVKCNIILTSMKCQVWTSLCSFPKNQISPKKLSLFLHVYLTQQSEQSQKNTKARILLLNVSVGLDACTGRVAAAFQRRQTCFKVTSGCCVRASAQKQLTLPPLLSHLASLSPKGAGTCNEKSSSCFIWGDRWEMITCHLSTGALHCFPSTPSLVWMLHTNT